MMKRLRPTKELDELVRELNTSAGRSEEVQAEQGEGPGAEVGVPSSVAAGRWTLPRAEPEGDDWLQRLLRQARGREATDLLLVADAPPALRIQGALEPVGDKALSSGATAMLCAALVPRERRESLAVRGSVDFSVEWPALGRFRCNVHRERGHWSAALRLFPQSPPDLDSLNLPEVLGRFAELQYGLVLVTGPTGSGKTTTIAALIRRILSRRRVHLITIEDPVEYEHAHGESVVEHVEIGCDAETFADALRSVLRQDPDVLLIGEMRDPASISIAITAAETGHLVLSTLHTGDAPQTIHRILDSYPAGQMEAVRAQLGISLAGIISQQLLPRADRPGRVPACEVLVATPGARNLIRRGRIEQLRSQIALERQAGMLDLDESLARLVQQGWVDPAEARTRARSPEEFDRSLPRRSAAE
jgi:twitching motility protein PilT